MLFYLGRLLEKVFILLGKTRFILGNRQLMADFINFFNQDKNLENSLEIGNLWMHLGMVIKL
jgi:hypothetical protein